MEFQGKTVLITGGTSGIGRAIAYAFCKAQADVIIIGKNETRGETVLELLRQDAPLESQKFAFYSLDISNSKSVQNFLSDLDDHIDILINCAGVTRDSLLMKLKEEEWDTVISTNLKSIYLFTHSLIRPMIKKRSGKIINITSIIGMMGNAGQTNYGASKMGVIGFTRCLAKEVAAKGISVNCIAPGFIKTPMTDKLSDSIQEKMLDSIPMRRFGNPEEVADLALFLASSGANYITGQVITIDGGMSN